MKFFILGSIVWLSELLTVVTAQTIDIPPIIDRYPTYPTRELGGITVVDTPIVRDAIEFARDHSSEAVFGHVMRAWLYGVLIIQGNETIQANVDLEVHALASVLHDLGWDTTPGSPLVSSDRRFEVDGAIAAREFIRSHEDGKKWDERRVQLVWDSIALHTEPSISFYKELDVQVMPKGTMMDFLGPGFGVSPEHYAVVGQQFPKDDLFASVNDTLIWLCNTKPQTTYDTAFQVWGDEYVQNFSAQGNRVFDTMFAKLYP